MFDSSLNELEYILLCLGIILFIFLIKRKNIGQNFVQDELRLGRSESNENASKLREEIIKTIEEKSRSQQESINNLNSLIDKQLRPVSYTHLTLPTKRIV